MTRNSIKKLENKQQDEVQKLQDADARLQELQAKVQKLQEDVSSLQNGLEQQKKGVTLKWSVLDYIIYLLPIVMVVIFGFGVQVPHWPLQESEGVIKAEIRKFVDLKNSGSDASWQLKQLNFGSLTHFQLK